MRLLSALLLILSLQVMAETESDPEVQYFIPMLGHVHQSPARPSPSLTTLQCGHPLKLISDPKVVVGPEWAYVDVADHKGFVWRKHLSTSKPDCFQARHPKFFDSLGLDLAELYYWGRLNDHWEQGLARP